MARTVMVTGGSGYFGSVLVDRLHAAGDRVVNYDISAATWHPPGVEWIEGDIRDPATLHDACRGVDVILHNVAQQPLARDRTLFKTVNVDGTATLLEAARAGGVSKVVYTSSTSVFGIPASNPVRE